MICLNSRFTLALNVYTHANDCIVSLYVASKLVVKCGYRNTAMKVISLSSQSLYGVFTIVTVIL